MSSTTTIPEGIDVGHVPDTVPAGLFRPAFPSADLVAAAGAMLTAHRVPDRDGEQVEGPRTRITVAPGVLIVSRRDPVRADRTYERELAAHLREVEHQALQLLAAGPVCASAKCGHLSCDWIAGRQVGGPARIVSWSRKSRANMVKTLAMLDYAPLFSDPTQLPAMVTLTYPGDWEPVAGSARVTVEHVKTLRKRFARAWGRPMVGAWKREFQRRGAPHWHVLMVPPAGEVGGESFRTWLSRTWAEVVGHPDPEEQRRHRLAGTGVDYAEGMRATDPKRLAVYFSKHGAYGAKEYQNSAPDLWVDSGEGVGRFWGVWGLDKATATVEVSADAGIAAARVMRRHARANGYSTRREVWRSTAPSAAAAADGLTWGYEPRRRYRRRRVTRRVRRMPGHAGFVTLNDAPAFVSQLARYLDRR